MWIDIITKDLLDRDPRQYFHHMSQSPPVTLTSTHLGVFPCYLKSVPATCVTEHVTLRYHINYSTLGQLCFKKDKLNVPQNIIKKESGKKWSPKHWQGYPRVEETVKKEVVKFDDEAALRHGSYGQRQRTTQELHSPEILDDKLQSRGV